MNLPYRFGRYVLLKKIAQGGMAEIFKAQYLGESGFSKEVCVKRLLPIWSDNPMFINMLIDEAKALVSLSHPNIVQVFELGRDDKTFFISMELVEGVDLRSLSEKVPGTFSLPLKFSLHIISEILKALRFAHRHLVHRDISPQNILLSFEGQVKVADFGIAKGMHRSIETTHHQVKGKYAYMSPEQARGETVDARTDLYAVGILLYELLEGRRLFDGINDLATLEQVREARLPRESLRSWPGALRAIVLRALQREAEFRYQTAETFLEDIHRFIAEEKCETSAEAFSEYLKEIFVKGSREETVAEEGQVFNTVAKPSSIKKTWRFAWGAAVALLMGMIGKDSLFVIEPSVAAAPLPAVSIKIPSLGSVTIDAKPKSVEGILKIDGKEKKFTTPFHLGGLDIAQAKEGLIRFKTDDGKIVEEKIIVSKENPNWVKTFVFEPEKPGVLMVSAKPWGEVDIPGIVSRRETPLAGLNLKAGKYRLRVHYPPADQWTEKEIELASGSQMICQAEFSSSPTLVCK